MGLAQSSTKNFSRRSSSTIPQLAELTANEARPMHQEQTLYCLSMTDSASIRVKGNDADVLFHWHDFDGDDCFRGFQIDIVKGDQIERFDFGECAVWGLRKSSRFFRGKLDSAGGGFRFPDIRTYDLKRTGDGFLLQIRLEAANRTEEIRFTGPTVILNDDFLKEYDGDGY
jgi:hypothetical protein